MLQRGRAATRVSGIRSSAIDGHRFSKKAHRKIVCQPQHWLSVAPTRWSSCFALPRHADGLFCPRPERFRILEDFFRELIVLHRSALIAERSKRAHAARFEVCTRRFIDLEVNCIVRDQRKENLARVNPHPAKHWPCTDTWHHSA